MISSDFKEISAGQFVSITGGLIAGIFLAYIKDDLLLIPGLLILIPGFLEMRGSLSGSLSSRFSSALHMGYIKPHIANTRFIRENILSSTLLALFVGVILAIVSLIATYIYFDVIYLKIIYIAVIATVLSDIIIIPLTIWTCFWIFRHNHDPDNMMGPYSTTVGDVVSMVSLFITVLVIA